MWDRRSNLLDFQWHQYVSWRSFAYSDIMQHHYVTVRLANLIQPENDQLSSFDKDMLEHVELRVPQFEQSLQRLQNLPRTGQGMLFCGFQWFSMAFRMMALQSLFFHFGSSHIRFGSLYPGRCFWRNGVNIVVPHCRQLWIVVACNTSNMNQWQWKRMVLVDACGNSW